MRTGSSIIFFCLVCCSGQREGEGEASSNEVKTDATSSSSSDNSAETTSHVPTSSEGDGSTEELSSGEQTTLSADLPPTDCDPFSPDCGLGMKCSPYKSQDFGSWDDSRCVPVVNDPDQTGEECKVLEELYSGIDTCDAGLMCWAVAEATFVGVCVPQCTGTSREPICTAPHSVCDQAGPLALCLPKCSPFLDCGFGTVCDKDPDDVGGFACAMDLPGGELFGSCTGAPGTCNSGLTCSPSTSSVECDQLSPGCCVPFCNVAAENVCPGAGQECQPLYGDSKEAPPLLWNLGLCTLPS